jgi:hypothetical protein
MLEDDGFNLKSQIATSSLKLINVRYARRLTRTARGKRDEGEKSKTEVRRQTRPEAER